MPQLDLPAGIAAPSSEEAGQVTFLAVGRQGYGNQLAQQIAQSMEHLAAERPTHFVVLAGDNFYPKGVRSVYDMYWVDRFEKQYDGQHLLGTPFYAVAGNHDHGGNIDAMIRYSEQQLGSGRWRMPGLFYARDFGRVDGRALLRVVFVDTESLYRDDTAAGLSQIESLLHGPGDPVWRVAVGHYPLRSLTENGFSKARVLEYLVEHFSGFDLYLSANDRFQQILQFPGEPVHVSANGGGEKLEQVPLRDQRGEFTIAQHGFARVMVDSRKLSVELYDQNGSIACKTSWTKGEQIYFPPCGIK